MNTKRENLLKLANNSEEKLLVARLLDKAEQAEKYYKVIGSQFLDLRSQELCKQVMRGAGISNYALTGGFDSAERKSAVFFPDYITDISDIIEEDLPFCALRMTNKAKTELTHRDFLGSLMGMGIKREMVGDIIVDGSDADILLMREVYDYISQNLEKVARDRVIMSAIPLSELKTPQLKFKVIRDTVASLRLDSVVGVAFSISRSNALELIKKGFVQTNGTEIIRPDFEVDMGTQIAVRGKGKAILKEISGTSKKGRIIIEIHKLI